MTDFIQPNIEDNLIYLAGMARSGTTVISRALDLHPEVYAPADETLFVEHVWGMRQHAPDFLLRRTLFGSGGLHYARFRQILNRQPAAYRRSLANRIEKAFCSLSFRDLYSLYPHVYFLAFPNGKEAANVRFWKDKSTVHGGFGLVAQHFPKTKFIFIVRNPLATVKSQIINSFGLNNRNVPIEKIQARDPMKNACYWYDMNRRIDAFHRSGQYDSLLILYEDFVAEPYETITRMFDHIGLSPLSRDFVDEYVLDRKAVSNDPGKRSAPLAGVHSNSVASHEEILSPSQIALTCSITAPVARTFGYDLPPHPNLLKSMLATPSMSLRQKASLLSRRMMPIFS
jgi:Sulfotransferase family